VLERQPAEVRQLLLRTSLLERVNGPLADRLTGSSGSYGILAGLEDAGAFVAAVDPERTWFRYHHLFGDLLALELRRTAPQEVPGLHTIAAEWWAEHGYPVEAIRHAQAAENWGLAARLLADNWFGLYLDGRLATRRELLSGFPAGVVAADPELVVLAGADKRAAGSLEETERYLGLAIRMSASVPEDRRGRFTIALGFERLELARARNDLRAVAEEAQGLLASTEATEFGLGGEVRTRVLTDLGIAEMWAGRLEDSERHLEQGLEEARRISIPMLELHALAHRALLSVFRSREPVEQRAVQAIELARKHGWDEAAPAAAAAYVAIGGATVWRGRLGEAESWLVLAERVLGHDTQPTASMLHATRGLLAFARGRHAEAAAAYRDAERMERLLVMPHMFTARVQALKLRMFVRVGETEQVERALAEMDEEVRETSQMRVVLAALRLARDDPEAAVDVLAPLLDDSTPVMASVWRIEALLLEAIARDALRDPGAGSRALERALDVAEPGGLLLPFLLYPTADLLQRQARLRTTPAARPKDAAPPREPLSKSELRVLRYLSTNLPAPEIAAELFVSLNTIRTHLRNVYAKLGVHSRADAVKRARELGLLSPSSLKH
jgi:LuxR family maltose regulon positive regulatory protein